MEILNISIWQSKKKKKKHSQSNSNKESIVEYFLIYSNPFLLSANCLF